MTTDLKTLGAAIVASVMFAGALQAQTQQAAATTAAPDTAAPVLKAPSKTSRLRGLVLPYEHVEGRIAYLKAELRINDAQASQCGAFAEALRSGAAAERALHDKYAAAGAPATAPDRADALVQVLAVRLDAAKAAAAAETQLYGALSPEQKKLADQEVPGPMGRL